MFTCRLFCVLRLHFRQKHYPRLTAKSGIGWFGNQTISSSTKHSKKQAQPGVFFGYFLLRKKNGGALLRAFENKQPKKVTT